MLLAIRDFIQTHQMVSNVQLKREFCLAEEALEPILDVWIRKGWVRKENPKAGCARRCGSCSVKTIQYYAWNMARVS